MSEFLSPDTNQSGKMGGDTSGLSSTGATAGAGFGGMGLGSTLNTSSGTGTLGGGGGTSSAGANGMVGGDVTDNTSIGSITINS